MSIGFHIALNRFIFFYIDILVDNPFLGPNDDALQKCIIFLTLENEIADAKATAQIPFSKNMRNPYVD